MSATAPAPSAGWYPVPGDPEGRIGYWDGAQWIGAPVPPPAAVSPAAVAPYTGPALAAPAAVGPASVAPSAEGMIAEAERYLADPARRLTPSSIAAEAAVLAEFAQAKPGIHMVGGIGSGIASLLFGLVFAFVGFGLPSVFFTGPAAGEVSSTATVVSISYTAPDSDGTTFCQPVVRFQGADLPLGMRSQQSPCPVSIGQRAKVFWVPGQPGSVRLDQSGFGWPQILFGVFGVVGAVLVISGLVHIVKSIRGRRTAAS